MVKASQTIYLAKVLASFNHSHLAATRSTIESIQQGIAKHKLLYYLKSNHRNQPITEEPINNRISSGLYTTTKRKMSTANQNYYAFNLDRYNSMLKTKSLGRPCIYLDEVDSTINVACEHADNTIVLARIQTKGVGQRDNKWKSPPGCAMASMKLECEQESFLGKRVSFLQHLVALSIVRTLEGYCKDYLGRQYIRLKWPNDIYHVDCNDKCKIGGVLIKTNTVQRTKYSIIISFGLNVSNSEPTTCIDDILSKFQVDTKIEIDELVANIVNNLEEVIANFSEDAFIDIKQDYMSRWIHTRQLVEDSEHGRVEIVGIDDDGYLLAKRPSDGVYCKLTSLKTP